MSLNPAWGGPLAASCIVKIRRLIFINAFASNVNQAFIAHWKQQGRWKEFELTHFKSHNEKHMQSVRKKHISRSVERGNLAETTWTVKYLKKILLVT